jgi:hypothetical protein
MFLPVAWDVAVSHFVDFLCVFLRMRVVWIYFVFWPVLEVVALVSVVEVRVRPLYK